MNWRDEGMPPRPPDVTVIWIGPGPKPDDFVEGVDKFLDTRTPEEWESDKDTDAYERYMLGE